MQNEIKNIQEVIDALYFSITDAHKDYPDNIYFRSFKKDIGKVEDRIKDAHISISHYLSFIK